MRLLIALVVLFGLFPDPVPGAQRDPSVRMVGKCRFAQVVSRDSRMLFWIGDRAAFRRRVSRVDAVRVLGQETFPEFQEDLREIGSDLFLFLPPALFEAVPVLLARGHGEMAISIEGFSIEDGKPRPDVLMLADVRGFEGLVASLSLVAEERVLTEKIMTRFGLPQEMMAESPVLRHVVAGVSIVEFRTPGGHRIALAEKDGVLFGARTVERVAAALERATRGFGGSLGDSARFRSAWQRVDPEPGALMWYADLRRLRQDESFRMIRPGLARSLFVDTLRPYDGLACAFRGTARSFETRLFLESGRMRTPTRTRLVENRRLESLGLLRENTQMALIQRASPGRIGEGIASLNYLAGGLWSPEWLGREIDQRFGARFFTRLGEHLTGELATVVVEPESSGEQYPRLIFLLRIDDQDRVELLFDELLLRSEQSGVLRRVQLGGGISFYEGRLGKNGFASRPAVTLRSDWLICASNALVLRSFLRDLESDLALLQHSERFTAPLDRLDRSVDEALTGLLMFDSRGMSRTGAALAFGFTRSMMATQANRKVVGLSGRLIRSLFDPELSEALNNVAVLTRAVPDGVLIEATGP